MTILIAQDAGFGRQISYRKLGKDGSPMSVTRFVVADMVWLLVWLLVGGGGDGRPVFESTEWLQIRLAKATRSRTNYRISELSLSSHHG